MNNNENAKSKNEKKDLTFSLRKIEPKDDAKMAAIIRRNFESYDLAIPGTAYFDPQLDKLAEFYVDYGEYYVLADEDGNALGGAGIGEFKDIEGAAELQKLYFDDSIKGLGLSKHLMSHLESRAKALGFKRMYIETHSKLETALHLYVKMGYKEIEKPSFVQHGAMDTFFIKEL